MKFVRETFLPWLMGLTTIMRYFVIALLVHVGIVALLGSIKIVAIAPKIFAQFTNPGELPPPSEEMPEDAFAAYRDFDYSGQLDAGAGAGDKGPGGVPTAGGEQYSASIVSSEVVTESPEVNEVIGVFSDAANAISRPSAGPSGVGMAAVSGLGEAMSGMGIKGPGGGGAISGRAGPARAVNLNKWGGSQRTEQAVLAALRWLKANQQSNGSWKGDDPAVSGLAVLAFLGHGENADSPEFGVTVSKGIDYLVSKVPATGNINGNMYHQGIIAIALCEALAMTQSPFLREPTEKAIEVILKAQRAKKSAKVHEGGWRYGVNDDTSDLSVTGWQIMALKSASGAGLSVPPEALDDAADYVWNQYGGEGFGYSGPGNSWTMTAVGTLCEVFLGQGKDRRLGKALETMSKVKVTWGEDSPGGHTLYGWYYCALGIFQGSITQGRESHWTSWNKDFQKALVDNQAEDGHWDAPEKSGEKGHGPVYATSLCTLMLEVYYRYLPIYKIDKDKPAGPATGGKLPTMGS